MTHKKIIFLAFSLCLLIGSGCKKDILGEGEVTETSALPTVWVESSVIGLVEDENGQALANVEIEHFGNSILSDENGFFRLPSKATTLSGGYITFQKEGYFDNAKFFFQVDPEDISFLRVKMLALGNPTTFSTTEAKTVTVEDNKAEIDFPANGFVDGQGNPYTGQVSVYSKYIDPNAFDLAEMMPGDLRGIDVEEARVQLSTFGMLATELRAADGRELELASGKPATIKMQIPDNLISSAPEVMPTWSFNDSGYWVEESEATATADGYYSAEVSHFSYWNYDAPWPAISFCGTISYDNGIPAANVKVCIKIVDSGITKCAWTNQRGKVGGLIPQNQQLEIIICDECGNVLYSQPIGPFPAAADFAITIPSPSDFLYSINGNLTCNGNPVTNGYVLIITDNGVRWVAPTDQDGNYMLDVTGCGISSSVSLQGFDIDEPGIGEVEIFDNPSNGFDWSQDVCSGGLPDEYLTMTLDGTPVLFEAPTYATITKYNNGDSLSIRFSSGSDLVKIRVQDLFLGPNNDLPHFLSRVSSTGFNCGNNCSDDINMEITKLGEAAGDLIEAKFSGETLGSVSGVETIIQIDGRFRIRIDEVLEVSSLSGTFYLDDNNNNTFDQGDGTITSSTEVSLYILDNFISRTWTDSLGFFEFPSVVKGETYTLRVSRPTNFTYNSNDVMDLNCAGITFDPTDQSTSQFLFNQDIDCINIPMVPATFDCNLITLVEPASTCTGEEATLQLGGLTVQFPVVLTYVSLDGNPVPNAEPFFLDPGIAVSSFMPAGILEYIVTDGNGELLCQNEFDIPSENGIASECDILVDVNCADGVAQVNTLECDNINAIDYQWSDGSTGIPWSTTAEGEYMVTVTDTNGCSGIGVVEVNFDSNMSGAVWLDENKDGRLDVAEITRFEGLQVSLFSQADTLTVLQTDTTGINGEYQFSELESSETYLIRVEIPEEFELSPFIEPNNPQFSFIDPNTGFGEVIIENCENNNRNIGLMPK